ncbi:hypothetical protein A2U01_0085836, partial [Trifolium medium]|nr:hypothetical protein [Trifolium medium]
HKTRPMAGANNNNAENVWENQTLIGAVHPLDRQLASGTEGDDPNHKEYVPEPPMDTPPLPPGALIETVMAVLVNAINRQGQYMRE